MTKIEIDLKELGLPSYDEDGEPTGNTTLQELIIEAAADKLMDTDYNVRSELREKVMQRYSQRINEKVEALITEAFELPIQRTTGWGEKKGEETTVREIIRETIEKYLKGKEMSQDGYGRNPKSLTQLIVNETELVLSKEMKATVVEAKKLVHEKVTDAALKAAIDQLNK